MSEQATAKQSFTCDDIGNAGMFIETHGPSMLYVSKTLEWYQWDAIRWASCERGEEFERAKDVAEIVTAIPPPGNDEKLARSLSRHKKYTRGYSGLANMLRTARTDPRISIGVDELDRNPYLLNCRNGTLDLLAPKGERFRAHDPSDRCTKTTRMHYDPSADHTEWENFLVTILNSNPSLALYVQVALGYSLSGLTSEQCFWLLHGGGRNGKSTFLNSLQTLLGDYAEQTPFTTLLSTRDTHAPRPDLARLRGSRFVVATEGDETARFSEALIKSLSAGDPITCRHLHQGFFTYTPAFKLWLATNHRPRIVGQDLGIWRRVKLIPFLVQIALEQVDTSLPSRLVSQPIASGLLNWLLEGWDLYREYGLQRFEPEAVRAATDQYRDDMDTLGQFLKDCCELRMGWTTPKSNVYDRYKDWSKEQGEFAWTHKVFSQKMLERGFDEGRTNTQRFWRGISLVSLSPSFAGPASDNSGDRSPPTNGSAGVPGKMFDDFPTPPSATS